MMEAIAIRCAAAVNLELSELMPLQGGLKELSETSFDKLKQSILRHGITFPFFVWQNEVELPSIDLEFFRDSDFQPSSTADQGRLDKKNPVRCPECGHEFVP